MEMKRLFLFSFVLLVLLQLVFSVCVTSSRPFAPTHPQGQGSGVGQSPESSLQSRLMSSSEDGEVGYGVKSVSSYEEVNKIGSSPPSCQHKCYGCSPCEATQVPTITSHVGIQYTNYEPEGWKCKCGPAFYTP